MADWMADGQSEYLWLTDWLSGWLSGVWPVTYIRAWNLKNSKLPFGNYQRPNGRQMQKCSRQIVQEQNLRLVPDI